MTPFPRAAGALRAPGAARSALRQGPAAALSAPLTAALVALLAVACVPGGVEESAVRRGDVAFARDSLEEALAEYRLAARQGTEEPEVLARVAHTYLLLGRIAEGKAYYERAAARDPRWADMGISDLVRLARAAAARNDRFQMAAAMEAALSLRPGLAAPDLSLPLARHYFQTAEFTRALPLYQRVMAEAATSSPAVVREVAEAHWQVGDCRGAIVYFDLYRDLASARERPQANWYIGDCSYRLGRDLARAAGEPAELAEALLHLERALEVGEPQNLLGQIWFQKGDVLSALGDCDGALAAYAEVRTREGASSSLARTAERRMADVRLGQGLVQIRGRCR